MNVFHLAIPTHDLDEAEAFYTSIMQATKARRYDDRVTFRFFDHQIVCHLAPDKIDKSAGRNPFDHLYPRHFGITFESVKEFEALYEQVKKSDWPLLKPVFERFSGLPERHQTFFVADPSHNLLEFKHYDESRYMY